MSNFLAIATVTAALGNLLREAIHVDVAGSDVTSQRPDSSAEEPQAALVNVFLYQVIPNPSLRNSDLPARRPDGAIVQRPQAALDLYYLLSFLGKETLLEPQRLLGSVVRQLHSRPLLTREMIRDTISNPLFSYLATSNLADAVETVRFTPLSLSLEEMSKIWSVMLQTPYILSVAYRASVVLIEEDVVPQSALPVRERRVIAVPFSRPLIESVAPQIVDPGGKLRIEGQNLRGAVTKVAFGATLADPDTVTGNRITVTLPGSLCAGVRTVQVVHDFDFGTIHEPHRGFGSNVAAFVLAPAIKTAPPISVARGAILSLSFTPAIAREQSVALLVGDSVIPLPPRTPSDPPTATSFGFGIPADISTGNVLLRIRVDGAESALKLDTNPASPTYSQYIGPTVTVT